MKNDEFLIEEEAEGQRIDKFLSDHYADLSRASIQRHILQGSILVNENIVKANYRLSLGDCLQVNLPQPEEIQILTEDGPLDILYEDDDIIVINKEQGMVVHPGAGNYQGTMVNRLLAYTDKLSSINGEFRPGIVHRLDKDSSGLLLVCKNDEGHLEIAKQFQEQTVERGYYALVKGLVNEPAGRVEAPIGRSKKDRKKMEVTFENSKEAITNYRVLERYAQGYSLLECFLETGRTHQIRVHLSWLGYPIVGDRAYGPRKQDFPEIEGQLLHARSLSFDHPQKKERVFFQAQLPDYFQEIINKLEEEENYGNN